MPDGIDRLITQLDITTGNMGWLMEVGAEQPEYTEHWNIEAPDLVYMIHKALDRAAGRVDSLAHQQGDRLEEHPELNFLSEALLKVSRGEAVDKNPFRREITSSKSEEI